MFYTYVLLFNILYTPCNFQKTLKAIKRQKQNLEHYQTAQNNLPNGPKQQGSILRKMESSEADQLLAGVFDVIIDKREADVPQIANDASNWK